MNTELKKKIEQDFKKRNLTPKSVANVVKVSLNGIRCYAKDGKSILLYLLCLVLEIIFGFIFRVNGLEWILIICILGIILSVELLNTAIEAACNAITMEYNKYIKIAKDCGSAATFVIFIVAVILNIIIFVPKIVALF